MIPLLRYIAAFLTCFSCLNAGENNRSNKRTYTEQHDADDIENIVQYLSFYSLHPYVEDGREFFLFPVGRALEAIIVRIEQNNVSYYAEFIVNQKNTQMLYITKEPEEMISAILFKDIMTIAQCAPKIQVLPSPFHVYIEKEKIEDGNKIQKWTFFTKTKKEELLVVLTPDGVGGMYFSIVGM